jgi:2-polyprenyl-6-methoxyphenol hydroxylase-like FAD-dependent oxidoreductase
LFAGEDVNLALEGCIELANAIQKSTSTSAAELDQNIQAFETDLFERVEKTPQRTTDMMHEMFMISDSPQMGIERFLVRAMEHEPGW